MDDNLPTEFDLIVVGTGLTESVVAAAASRIGKSVLHLDSNDFYGGYWASFNLDNIKTVKQTSSNGTDDIQVNELHNNSIKLSDNLCRLVNVSQEFHVCNQQSDEVEGTADAKWTVDKVMKEFRKFNIDITPKLLFSRGDLVELLISSNICRYAEFRSVDRITTLINDELNSVPCSRSDVFTTKDVSVVEKRLLMKLLSTCLNYEEDNEEFKDFEGKTFQEYLKSKKLTPKLEHYILHAISMSNTETSFKVGLARTNKFLSSLGRYGNTPFLFPMYGCGEIPQCFCRLCAVFGGVYCLKRAITEIYFADNGDKLVFDAIQCDTQKIQAKNIVFGHGSIASAKFEKATGSPPNEEIDSDATKVRCGNLSRGIFIADTPIGGENLNSGGGGVIFLKMPSSNGDGDGAFVIQLSHWSGCCPKGFYLVHITCQTSGTSAKDDLAEYVEKLFKNYQWQEPVEIQSTEEQVADETQSTEEQVADETKSTGGASTPAQSSPRVLWSTYYNIPSCSKCKYADETPIPGLHLACGPFFELDYDKSIENAKKLFTKIYPTEEFLPRAPDPDEIIIGDDDNENIKLEIQEKIADVVEGIDNDVKCIQENDLNESIE
ncbi:rab proteins geranylgeranyltransferase component A isoform X2 [Bradysia coprophila]|nr:rab proteins geranylgeranyltransferase component A isoform X2 [Bradysia coprophila]